MHVLILRNDIKGVVMKEIKLSIVVLVYNLEKYLPRCMESLVNQTLEDIEILCVDDGSTDSAPEIIEEYSRKYPHKVKAFHKENGGEYTTRAYGLNVAKGEYVAFVDTDDYLELNWAEKLYNAAKANDADIAVCAYERINFETQKTISVDMDRENITKKIAPDDDFIAYITTSLWNKIFKLEKIKECKFFPLVAYNDALFLLQVYIKAEKITLIPDVLYHYYVRYDSQINSLKGDIIEKLKKYLLEVKQIYIENQQYERMKEILDLMAFIHLGISAMYRASYDKSVDMKKSFKETKAYLDKHFPTWRKSPFLKIKNCYNKGIRHIGLYGISILYKLNLEMVFIKVYRFFIDRLKIDIKF